MARLPDGGGKWIDADLFAPPPKLPNEPCPHLGAPARSEATAPQRHPDAVSWLPGGLERGPASSVRAGAGGGRGFAGGKGGRGRSSLVGSIVSRYELLNNQNETFFDFDGMSDYEDTDPNLFHFSKSV